MTETDEIDSEPTDAEFVSIVDTAFQVGSAIDRGGMARLIALARRGAAVPDEPTHEMIEAAVDAWTDDPDQKLSTVYRAMLQAALRKDTP